MADFGKRIRLLFDGELYNVVSAELITKFRLKEDAYGTYIYPTSVAYGASNSELYIDFTDFNQAQYPLTLEYLGGTMRGRDLTVDPFEIVPVISWWNLNRNGDYEYLEITEVTVAGEILLGFDGKTYIDNSYAEIASVTVAGTNAQAVYTNGYSLNSYAEIASVTVAGQYCDSSGTPL